MKKLRSRVEKIVNDCPVMKKSGLYPGFWEDHEMVHQKSDWRVMKAFYRNKHSPYWIWHWIHGGSAGSGVWVSKLGNALCPECGADIPEEIVTLARLISL